MITKSQPKKLFELSGSEMSRFFFLFQNLKPLVKSYLSDVAFMAESGIRPDVIPNGLITLHSGSRIHFAGFGLMEMYPGLLHPNCTSDPFTKKTNKLNVCFQTSNPR